MNTVHASLLKNFPAHILGGNREVNKRRQTPNELTVQYARIGSMARDVVLMCTSRIRLKSFVVSGESVSEIGFVVIVAGAPCPPGITLEYEQVRP